METCLFCNKFFTSLFEGQQCCSNRCYFISKGCNKPIIRFNVLQEAVDLGIEQIYSTKQKNKRQCVYCGKDFTLTRNRRYYCSDVCKSHKKHKHVERTVICKICSCEFVTFKSNQIICGVCNKDTKLKNTYYRTKAL